MYSCEAKFILICNTKESQDISTEQYIDEKHNALDSANAIWDQLTSGEFKVYPSADVRVSIVTKCLWNNKLFTFLFASRGSESIVLHRK